MLELSSVTLIAVTSIKLGETRRAIERCTKVAKFHDVKLMLPQPHLRSIRDYSTWIIHNLHKHVDTDHALIVQWDGWITHPNAWDDAFLNYDYIGSPWNTGEVGNGGFSLRSRRLIKACSEIFSDQPIIDTEDRSICIEKKYALARKGMIFAPTAIALRFSVEGQHDDASKAFGFHGLYHMKKFTKPMTRESILIL